LRCDRTVLRGGAGHCLELHQELILKKPWAANAAGRAGRYR
jgi:hypothetical protein